MVPLAEYRARRIAILKPSALGDIIHALPVLAAVRAKYPESHITWVVNRPLEPLLVGNPDLDATLPVDRHSFKRGIAKAFRAFNELASALRRGRFDLVIDLQGLLRTGIMAGLTGAPRKLGLQSAREGAKHFYTDSVPPNDRESMHAVDRLWKVAEALGVGESPKRFFVPVQESAAEWAAEELRELPRPWVVVAAGARWLTKRWPPEHFADLVQRTQAKFGGTAVLIGAPDEQPIGAKLHSLIEGPARNYTGRTDLARMVALLAKADAVIANDTGPLHVAAALGRPVVAPYTCTQVRLHGPYGVERGPVETAVWCQGSYRKKCDRLECMPELRPERLWYFLREVLTKWSQSSRSA